MESKERSVDLFDSSDIKRNLFRALSEADWEAFYLSFKAPKAPKFSKVVLSPKENAVFTSGIKSVEQITRWITISNSETVAVPVNGQEFILVELGEGYSVKEEMKRLLGNAFKYQIRRGSGNINLIGGAVYFSVLCKLLSGGEWVHLGSGMEYFVGSEFIGARKISTVSCFSSRIVDTREIGGDLIRVTIEIKSILLAIQTLENASKVLCLPRCSSFADLGAVRPAREGEAASLQNYWLMCHGYALDKETIESVANVIFSSGSYSYPLCVLLESITILPKKSSSFKLLVLERLFRDISSCSSIPVVPSKAPGHTVAPTFCSASKVYSLSSVGTRMGNDDHSRELGENEGMDKDGENHISDPLGKKSSYDEILSPDIMDAIDGMGGQNASA